MSAIGCWCSHWRGSSLNDDHNSNHNSLLLLSTAIYLQETGVHILYKIYQIYFSTEARHLFVSGQLHTAVGLSSSEKKIIILPVNNKTRKISN